MRIQRTPHPSRLTPCHLPLKGKALLRRAKLLPDILADAGKILPDVRIGVSQHIYAKAAQRGIPLGVCGNPARVIVLPAVERDCQLRVCTVEINDIVPDDLLPMKRDRQRLEKIVPQVPFFFRHVPAKPLRISRQPVIAVRIHAAPRFLLLSRAGSRAAFSLRERPDRALPSPRGEGAERSEADEVFPDVTHPGRFVPAHTRPAARG